MKTLFITLLSAVLLFNTAIAQTNNNPVMEQVKNNAKQQVTTNLNEVIVDILRGVKIASDEVYQASKTAIGKSVDFTMEQAPLVVKEFLTWNMAKAIIRTVVWATVSGVLFYFGRVANKRSKDPSLPDHSERGMSKGDFTAFKWTWRTIAIIIFLVNLGCNGMTITKIAVAPRVFLIEYVVDVIQSAR